VGTIENNISGANDEAIGYLKASPNGKKLALAICYTYDIVELYDFDASTGVITNPITIPIGYDGVYGISFSPDNSKLYATIIDDLVQYDLSSGVAATIIASEIAIASLPYGLPRYFFGAIQIGPDDRIYVASPNFATLSIINNPNALGAACNYLSDTIAYLGGSGVGVCEGGLPNFIDGGVWVTNPLLTTNNIDTTLCVGSNIKIDAGGGFSKYSWSTGDTTQIIKINNPGIYTVKCKLDSAQLDSSQCFFRYDTFKVALQTYPKVNLGRDTDICSGYIRLSVPVGDSSYLWSTGSTYNSISVTNAGTYWVAVDLNTCISYDSITIYSDTNHIHIVFPNIITPNGDNINDFIQFGNPLFNTLHIEIYNRWGRRIFISDDPECVWYPEEDPLAVNETIDDGTVYYVAKYSLSCGGETETKTTKGFITVVK
jgi:hypothetical protein